MNIKQYLYSLRFYILFAILIFAFSFLLGYLAARVNPLEALKIIVAIAERFIESDFLEKQPFRFIFLNNSIRLFLIIPFGIFIGIPSLFLLVITGGILGLFFYFSQSVNIELIYLKGILPHGIFEITALILSVAISLKIAASIINAIFTNKKVTVVKDLKYGMQYFLKLILPLIFLAALIETFITPRLIDVNRPNIFKDLKNNKQELEKLKKAIKVKSIDSQKFNK